MEQFTILIYTPHSTHVSILHTIRFIYCSSAPTSANEQFTILIYTPHSTHVSILHTIRFICCLSAPTSANGTVHYSHIYSTLHTRLNFTHHTLHLLLICSHVSKWNSSLFSTNTPHSTHVSIFQLHFTATLHTCLQDTACTYCTRTPAQQQVH